MVKIAFHDNQLCERGTTVSLYDYAYYNKHYLKNESIIMFQGNDNREFWVRAEERNAETANKYKKMGLADYAAMEAFKRYYF